MKRQLSLWAAIGAVAGLSLLLGSPQAASADAPAIASFTGAGGSGPTAALIEGSDGNFYGTTYGGGSSNKGTAFKVTPAGAVTPLVSFTGGNGAYLSGPLVQGADGNFYGTTIFGGSSNNGTIFKLTTDGTAAGSTLTTLLNFNNANGYIPYGPMILGSDGSFYGTTVSGGVFGTGTIFKMTTDGTAAGTTLTTLFNLAGTDNQHPYAGLVQGHDGNFYGALWDGANGYGYGRLFKLTTNGTLAGSTLTTLVNFHQANGANTPGSLVQGSDGSFYGDTYNGGASGNGIVFKMTTDGTLAGTTLTTLLSFNGANGAHPHASVILGDDGNIYGTTYQGGPGNNGTVFKLTPTGDLRTLVTFHGSNGLNPYAPLIQGSDRKLYGTTISGGSSNFGTVLEIDPRAIEAVTFTPMTLAGGSAAMGEVTLSHVAATDMKVTLISSNPAVLPIRSSVTITAGHRHALFTVNAKSVTTLTKVTITATLNGVSSYSTVRVTP